MTLFELMKTGVFDEACMIKVLSAITLGAIKGIFSQILDRDEVDDIFGDSESDAINLGINASIKVLLNTDAKVFLKEAANDAT